MSTQGGSALNQMLLLQATSLSLSISFNASPKAPPHLLHPPCLVHILLPDNLASKPVPHGTVDPWGSRCDG